MSTREEHPIDERFRALLHDAEATPPPAAWQGVRARMPAHSRQRRRWLLGLLLLLVLTSAGIWAVGTGRSATFDPLAAAPPTEGMAVAPGEQRPDGSLPGGHTAQDIAAQGEAPPSMATPILGEEGSIDHGRERQTLETAEVTRSGSLSASASMQAGEAARPHDRTEGASVPAAGLQPRTTQRPTVAAATTGQEQPATASAPAITAAIDLFDQQATWAPIRQVSLMRDPGVGTPLARIWDPVVLPRGEWWLGVHVGSYLHRQRWRGEDQGLNEALSGAYGTDGSVVPGLAVERRWRSGWGFATGAWASVSEQRFHAVSRRSWVEQEVHTYLVTLNDQVFVSDVDTVTQVMHEQSELNGSTRRTVLFVPAEALWARQVRRLHYGIRAGVVAELPLGGSGTLLGRTEADAPLQVVAATGPQLKARRPAALSLSAGIEVGYALHERWSLAVGARYMHGALAFGAARDAYGLTDRWGLECRLLHHIKWQR